jgi:hypothetical protein
VALVDCRAWAGFPGDFRRIVKRGGEPNLAQPHRSEESKRECVQRAKSAGVKKATTVRVLAKKRPPDIQKGNQQALGSQGCLR